MKLEKMFDFNYLFGMIDGLTDEAKEAGITNIVIPKSINGILVKQIGINAFRGCRFIKSITIPDSVKSIKMGAFSNCTSLENINIPKRNNKY